MLLNTLHFMWPIHLQGLRLLLPTVKEMLVDEVATFNDFGGDPFTRNSRDIHTY